jgi:hypothetical protein
VTHVASYTMLIGAFPAVKRPGLGVDHSLDLAPRLNKEESYRSTPSLGILGRTLYSGNAKKPKILLGEGTKSYFRITSRMQIL